MDQILAPHAEYAAAYIDDIVIFIQTWLQHKRALWAILAELRKVRMIANLWKCALVNRQTKYLGFLVGQGTIRLLADKVEIIHKFATSQNSKQLQSFLGLANYY